MSEGSWSLRSCTENVCPTAEKKEKRFPFFIRACWKSPRIPFTLWRLKVTQTNNMPYAHVFVLQWVHSLSRMRATLHLYSHKSERVAASRDNEPWLGTPWERLYCVCMYDERTAWAIRQQDGTSNLFCFYADRANASSLGVANRNQGRLVGF